MRQDEYRYPTASSACVCPTENQASMGIVADSPPGSHDDCRVWLFNDEWSEGTDLDPFPLPVNGRVDVAVCAAEIDGAGSCGAGFKIVAFRRRPCTSKWK